MKRILSLIAVMSLCASVAWAQTEPAATSQPGSQGILVQQSVIIAASPEAVYKALGRVERWWSDAHTFSGAASNLSLALKAGGCFCETWKQGSVEHMRVVNAQPGRKLVLRGGLGPLQNLGDGALTLTLEPEGSGTYVGVMYVGWGFDPAGLGVLGPLMDKILAEQTGRLKTFVEAGAR